MQKLNLRFFASPCYAQNDGNGVILRFSQENRSNPENYDIISILKRLTPFAGLPRRLRRLAMTGLVVKLWRLLRRCFATSRNDNKKQKDKFGKRKFK